MLASFQELNLAQLDEFGVEVQHRYEGGSTTVTAVRIDPRSLNEAPAGAFMALFGSIEHSGWDQVPVKNDSFVLDENSFRVFEVKREDQTDGIWIFLEQQR